MLEPPRIVETVTVQTALIPITVPSEQFRAVTEPGIGDVLTAIAQQRMTPARPWFTHRLRMDPIRPAGVAN